MKKTMLIVLALVVAVLLASCAESRNTNTTEAIVPKWDETTSVASSTIQPNSADSSKPNGIDSIELKTDISKYYKHNTEFDLTRCASDMGIEPYEEAPEGILIFTIYYDGHTEQNHAQGFVNIAWDGDVSVRYLRGLWGPNLWVYECMSINDLHLRNNSISITDTTVCANESSIRLAVYVLEQVIAHPYENPFEGITEYNTLGGGRYNGQ